jgi:hypothetical protein
MTRLAFSWFHDDRPFPGSKTSVRLRLRQDFISLSTSAGIARPTMVEGFTPKWLDRISLRVLPFTRSVVTMTRT